MPATHPHLLSISSVSICFLDSIVVQAVLCLCKEPASLRSFDVLFLATIMSRSLESSKSKIKPKSKIETNKTFKKLKINVVDELTKDKRG